MQSSPSKRLEWTERALADLVAALDYIFEDSPRAAGLVKNRVLQAVEFVAEYPAMGTPGRVARTREYPVQNTSLTIVYRVRPNVIHVARVLHQRRLYP